MLAFAGPHDEADGQAQVIIRAVCSFGILDEPRQIRLEPFDDQRGQLPIAEGGQLHRVRLLPNCRGEQRRAGAKMQAQESKFRSVALSMGRP